jgi:glutathione peroxidase
MLEKTDVNGEGRAPLYQALTETADAKGVAGDVQWNFEKFLLAPSGEPVARFRPQVLPKDTAITEALDGLSVH